MSKDSLTHLMNRDLKTRTSTHELLEYLDSVGCPIARRTLTNYVTKNLIPKPIKVIRSNLKYYNVDEVLEELEAIRILKFYGYSISYMVKLAKSMPLSCTSKVGQLRKKMKNKIKYLSESYGAYRIGEHK